MARLYLVLLLLGVLGGVGYGAYGYYTSTQQRIQTLSENNAKLEVAIEQSEKSVNLLKSEAAKNAELSKNLQVQLQKAEAYGDELRSKLSKLNLVVEALKDSKTLEGKMNGATAKLWRDFMEDTGNVDGSKSPLPQWLQQPETGAGSESGNGNPKDTSTSSSETETSNAK